MGNCVRRETGYEIEEEEKSPPGAEIIDKIIKMKHRTRVKRRVEHPPNLQDEIIDEIREEIQVVKNIKKVKKPETVEEPPVEVEVPRKSKRIFMGDYLQNKKDIFTSIRDSTNLKEEVVGLYI